MDIKQLVESPALLNELLRDLDEIARDIDSYEYGLPMYDEGAKARMREAICRWAVKDRGDR